jgi:hypothetical protein
MQWILLLIQMNASIADLHYVELYETLEAMHRRPTGNLTAP